MSLQLVCSERDRNCAPDRGPTSACKTRPFCTYRVADEATIQAVCANRAVQYSMDLGTLIAEWHLSAARSCAGRTSVDGDHDESSCQSAILDVSVCTLFDDG